MLSSSSSSSVQATDFLRLVRGEGQVVLVAEQTYIVVFSQSPNNENRASKETTSVGSEYICTDRPTSSSIPPHDRVSISIPPSLPTKLPLERERETEE